MNAVQVFALIRQLMTLAGGYVAAHGWMTSEDYAAVTGAALTIASVAWSLYASRKDQLVRKVAEIPEVSAIVTDGSAKGSRLADRVESGKVSSKT